MFQVMLRKLLSKKWMSACLMTGILLLIATAVSFPIYRGAAYDRMLRDEFRGYLSANGEWPTLNKFVMISGKDAGGRSISRVEGMMEEICGRLGVTEKESIFYYSLAKTEVESLMKRKDLGPLSLRLGFLSNLPQHAELLGGEMYSEGGISDDGCLEAVMSQSCMVNAGLLVGETILFPELKDPEGNSVRVRITGVFRGQIFRVYFYQSLFLALLGAAAGVPLGSVFAGVLGSARSFLEFDLQDSMTLLAREAVISVETLACTAAAMGICILVMTLLAIKHSRVSIVNLKQQKAARKHSWWELGCLDVVCLVVALYGYYTGTKNQEAVAESVLRGEAMDPLQYVSSSLFIVGAGLLALRLQPLLIKCIYLLGRRFWRPASYISFLENEKNGRKQQFIMLFLIMAVSLGMFHATAARTILQNALDNKVYLDGVLVSKWGIVPYEVWMSARRDADENEFYRWVQEEKVQLVRYVDRKADMEAECDKGSEDG